VLFQLTRELGLRGIAEYRYERFFREDGTLDRKRDQLFYDVLVTYLIQPQQSIQAGFTQLGGADLTTPMTPYRRGGLVKVSYVWRW